MTSEELREKVARAICVALGDDPDREGCRLTAYDAPADAALSVVREAMRETLPETTAEKAPVWMRGGEASCWADGWNAAVAMFDAASPLREPSP